MIREQKMCGSAVDKPTLNYESGPFSRERLMYCFLGPLLNNATQRGIQTKDKGGSGARLRQEY